METTSDDTEVAAIRRRAVVIEDDPDIRTLLTRVLSQADLEVTEATGGRDGLEQVRLAQPDLITLDLNLPDLDGVEVCRQLRQLTDAYVIMLTAQAEEIDRLVGLEVGADDYVTKPFSPRELRARVAAMFRRPRQPSGAASSGPVGVAPGESTPMAAVLVAGDVRIDVDAHEARHQDQVLPLTVTEFAILTALAEQPRRVWTRDALLRHVWDTEWAENSHMVDVHVANLRRKLAEAGADSQLVRTVRGVGYRLGGG